MGAIPEVQSINPTFGGYAGILHSSSLSDALAWPLRFG
jgi:hypothetical protein